MMDSIADLMKDKRPQEPPQMKALREYIENNHGVKVHVSASQFGYTVTVPSAPLATILQMELPQIKAECNLDKKLFIQIAG